MALTLATQILQQSPRKLQYRRTLGQPGRVIKNIPMCEWGGSGFAAGYATPQTTRITFPAPATLPIGAEVWITIVDADCNEHTVRLHSCDTATAQPLNALALAAITGITSGGVFVNTGDAPGFSAAIPATPTNSIDITGPVGESFSIKFGDFGISKPVTINGTTSTVVMPAVPTVSQVAASSCNGKLYPGRAVVSNHQLVSTQQPQSGPIDPEHHDLIAHPTNHPLERFLGWSVRKDDEDIKVRDCCETLDCDDAYECHDCIHWVKTCCHDQVIELKLEAFPAGTTIPSNLIGLPLYYRHTAAPGYTQLGAPALLLGAADPKLSLARSLNTKAQWVVLDVVDHEMNIVRAGVAN